MQITIGRHRQGAGDRCCRHHQHINAVALVAQHQPLAHPEPVLFIDHTQPEIMETDPVGQQCMGSHHDADGSIRQPFERGVLFGRLHLAEQKPRFQAKRFQQLGEGGVMLAGQNFSRGQKRGLSAGFNHAKHGNQCHQRLAGTDITLNQPQHPVG